MANFNRVILMGNLTRDPQLRSTNNGGTVADLSLAVNRTWKDKNGKKQEEVTYVPITLWGRTAEVAAEYSRKGSQVLIEGRLKLDQWEDRNTGDKRQRLSVVGESYTMIGGRTPQGDRQQHDGPDNGGYGDPAAGIPDDETPF